MMSYGKTISDLRKSNNMTQKQLGDELNVTYQAVSKWERDEALPDFDTMCKIAKIFGVPVSYFDERQTSVDNDDQPDEEPATMIGVCSVCGRILYEGDNDPSRARLICKGCAEEERKKAEEERRKVQQLKERQEEEERKKRMYAAAALKEKFNRRTVKAAIVGGLITLLVIIFEIIGCTNESTVVDGAMIFGCIILPVMIFSWVFQLFWDGAVRTVTCWGFVAIRMPGIIFTADLDGLIFLAVMKVFLTFLSWLITVFLIVLASVAAMFVGLVTFVPVLIKIHRRNTNIL